MGARCSTVAIARRSLVLGGALAATLSASCTAKGPDPMPPTAAHPSGQTAQPMDPTLVLGLWKSSFGPVKIEVDETGGPNAVAGVWTYDKDGTWVIGYFEGRLEGNVMAIRWHEPAQ